MVKRNKPGRTKHTREPAGAAAAGSETARQSDTASVESFDPALIAIWLAALLGSSRNAGDSPAVAFLVSAASPGSGKSALPTGPFGGDHQPRGRRRDTDRGRDRFSPARARRSKRGQR